MGLKVDSITNAAGTGSPTFPNGIAVSQFSAGNDLGEVLSNTSTNLKTYNPSGNINVTLDNTWQVGKEFTIVHTGVASSTALINLRTQNGQTIATVYPKTSYKCVATTATPTNAADWTGLTPIISPWIDVSSLYSAITLGGETVFSRSVFMKRNGDSMTIRSFWDWSTAGGGTLTFTLHSSLQIDLNKVRQDSVNPIQTQSVGVWYRHHNVNNTTYDNSAANAHLGPMFIRSDTPTAVFFALQSFSSGVVAGGQGFQGNTFGSFFLANEATSFEFEVPISTWTTTKG